MRSATRLVATLLAAAPLLAAADVHVVIVEGLAGEPRFGEQFAQQVAAIAEASESLTAAEQVRVFRAADAERGEILAHFESLSGRLAADDSVIVYLLGHGSYDDVEYKFNILGPDLTGADIAQALDALPAPRQLFVNTSSASGALADRLAAGQRTVVLATRSGAERHATRFGQYFAEALALATTDTDKNGIVTAREAFDYAERRVADSFEREARLSTEHPHIAGALANRFAVARLAAPRPVPVVDTELAGLTDARDELNADIDALRLRRDDMSAGAYRSELLGKMLELARLEDAIEARERELDGRD